MHGDYDREFDQAYEVYYDDFLSRNDNSHKQHWDLNGCRQVPHIDLTRAWQILAMVVVMIVDGEQTQTHLFTTTKDMVVVMGEALEALGA